MKKIVVLFLAVFAFSTLSAVAQFGSFGNNKVTLISGDLKFLKSAQTLKIEYNYDDMLVGDMKEADYIVRHTADLNKGKKGSGEEWQVKWVSDRVNRFEPAFEKRFIKTMTKAKIAAGQNKNDAAYKMIVKTIVTEPGLYTGVSVAEKPTYINTQISFVEVANPDNQLCVITCSKMIGDAGEFANYDIGLRISKAYETCGYYLSAYLVKALKKIK
jgi:hypothetical protein